MKNQSTRGTHAALSRCSSVPTVPPLPPNGQAPIDSPESRRQLADFLTRQLRALGEPPEIVAAAVHDALTAPPSRLKAFGADGTRRLHVAVQQGAKTPREAFRRVVEGLRARRAIMPAVVAVSRLMRGSRTVRASRRSRRVARVARRSGAPPAADDGPGDGDPPSPGLRDHRVEPLEQLRVPHGATERVEARWPEGECVCGVKP